MTFINDPACEFWREKRKHRLDVRATSEAPTIATMQKSVHLKYDCLLAFWKMKHHLKSDVFCDNKNVRKPSEDDDDER
jgi:hypothetical protein